MSLESLQKLIITVRKDDKKAPTFEVLFNIQFNVRLYNINFTRVSTFI